MKSGLLRILKQIKKKNIDIHTTFKDVGAEARCKASINKMLGKAALKLGLANVNQKPFEQPDILYFLRRYEIVMKPLRNVMLTYLILVRKCQR